MKPHQGIFTSYNRRKDRSVNITFNLLELSSNDLKELDETCDQFGVVYFKETGHLSKEEKHAIDNADIPNDGKSQSSKIRHAMYGAYKRSDSEMNWNQWYKSQTNKHIEHYNNMNR